MEPSLKCRIFEPPTHATPQSNAMQSMADPLCLWYIQIEPCVTSDFSVLLYIYSNVKHWHSENRNIVCACCLNKDLACSPVTDLGYDSNHNSWFVSSSQAIFRQILSCLPSQHSFNLLIVIMTWYKNQNLRFDERRQHDPGELMEELFRQYGQNIRSKLFY